LKRYVTLKCSACAREKDELIDQTHYTPDRCTITLNCEGRLAPIGYTSAGTQTLSVPPTGLENWYPRGSVISSTTPVQADVLYNTSTGEKQQVVLAVYDPGSTISNSATAVLNLVAEQQTPRDYRQYVYRRSGSITVVNGVEDGAAKKVLRYDITGPTPDVVEVYVDGVKRNLGTGSTEYQLYDGSPGSPVPLNSVLFNSPVTGVLPQIDVIVTKPATISSIQLTFTRAIDNEGRVGTGAWEGVNRVSTPILGLYSLFYCDFANISSTFTTDVKLRLNMETPSLVVDSSNSNIDPNKAAILLSRSGLFTQLDRQKSTWIQLSDLGSNTNYLVVKLDAGKKNLFVTETSIRDVFPPLTVHRFDAPVLQSTDLTGNDDAAQPDNSIIIGPDA
jgi:hypothetical protein